MRWRKCGEMAFLTSRNEVKHVLLALGADCTARDAVKAKPYSCLLESLM